MSKSLNKIKVFLSFGILVTLSCDFRNKNAVVETIEDNTCVITWQNTDGTILDQEIYKKGELPEYKKKEPINNDKSNNAYQFIGWEPEIREVDENMTYTAVYETIKAAFTYRLSNDGNSYQLIKYTPEVKQSTVTIPDTYQGKPVTVIDNYALRGCSWVTTINIPPSITTINDYAFQNTGISSITLSNNVKNLGSSVFRDCKNLQSVSLPSGISKIPDRFFYNCDNLTTFSTPSSVTSIGDKAFYNCDNLKTVTLSDNITSINNKAFNQCEKLSTVNISASSKLRELDEYAFSETAIESLTLPSTLQTISSYCFSQCDKLESLTISSQNTNDVQIKNSAFEGCRKLRSLSLPRNISNYEKAAFKDCESLTSFTLGQNTTEISESLFQNCSSLTTLNLTNSDILVKIGKKALSNTAISSFDIPETVSSIGDEAFSKCSNLKRVIFPGGNFYLGNNVFSNCSSLSSFCVLNQENLTRSSVSGDNSYGISNSTITNISIPNSTYSISEDAFSAYTNLNYNEYAASSDTGYKGYYLGNISNPYLALIKVEILTANSTVKIHPSCKVVANKAFTNCNKTFNVHIDLNLANLGEATFYNSKLKNITFASNISMPVFKSRLFDNCTYLESISLPRDLNTIEGTPFNGCTNLETILTPQNYSSQTYRVIDNSLLVSGNKIICGVKDYDFAGLLDASPSALDGIDTIGAQAFCKKYNETQLCIPGCIKEIESYAFDGANNLNSTIIGYDSPTQLTTISSNAFGSLPESTNRVVRYNGPLTKWMQLNITGFNSLPISKEGTTTLYLSENSNQNYSQIPSTLDLSGKGIKKIPNYAFASVKNITQCFLDSNGIEEIGDYAFYNCTNLTMLGFKKNNSNINTLTKYGNSSFEKCSSLQIRTYEMDNTTNNVTTYNSLTHIGEKAFKGCTTLSTKFYFKNIKVVKSDAFQGATSLSNTNFIIEMNSSLIIGNNISFSGSNSITGIIVIFSSPSYTLTISSSAFTRTVKIYCTYDTIPPNLKNSDYNIVNNNSSYSRIYYHYYPELNQTDLNSSQYNWFTITNFDNYDIQEGKPQTPSN